MKMVETIDHAQIEFFYFDNQGTTWYNRLGLFKLLERMKSWNHSLYEHLQYTLEIKTKSNICDFEEILKTECDLQHLTRNCGIKNLDVFERDEADA